jgi:hypothetical protein
MVEFESYNTTSVLEDAFLEEEGDPDEIGQKVGSLLEQHGRARRWGGWFSSWFGSSSKSESNSHQDENKESTNATVSMKNVGITTSSDSSEAAKPKSVDKGSNSSMGKGAKPVGNSTVGPKSASVNQTFGTKKAAELVESCNRARCGTNTGVHYSSQYHYVRNTVDTFKTELYQYGPFYTSFHVPEDFTWFYHFWPDHGYTHQWGAKTLGGHAAVLVGWEGDCEYHQAHEASSIENSLSSVDGGHSALQAGNRYGQGRAGMIGSGPYPAGAAGSTGSGRRRTARGECWHLRNSWGKQWADAGYFRMYNKVLTGTGGMCLHIASAAADGPKSMSVETAQWNTE